MEEFFSCYSSEFVFMLVLSWEIFISFLVDTCTELIVVLFKLQCTRKKNQVNF